MEYSYGHILTIIDQAVRYDFRHILSVITYKGHEFSGVLSFEETANALLDTGVL